MIIYHVASFYQALTCCVHSKQYKEHRKILLVGESIKVALLRPSILEDIFDEVIYIDMNYGLARLDTCEEEVIAYFDNIFANHEIECDENTKIFAAGAHFNFGLYLTFKQIPFYFMEDACGIISNYKHLININKARLIHPLLEENGLYDASNTCIQGVVCNAQEQESGYEREDIIHFDTLSSLFGLSISERNEIMRIFMDIDEISIPDNSVIVLSQHYANLNMMSYERQALLYGLVFDYYLKGRNILIKKHPYDFMPYEIIYPKVRHIKERFPSEFLPLIFDKDPEMVVTISSTGIKSLKSVVKEHMEFDFDFEQHFDPIHKVYFALEILLKQGNVNKIYTVGINEAMIENMCKYTFNLADVQVVSVSDISEIEEDGIVFVDRTKGSCIEDLDIERVAEYFSDVCPAKQIFYMNSDRNYVFHKAEDETVWSNIVPIVITKENKNMNRDYELYNDFEAETFYLYTKNEEIRRMALELNEKKELDNLQIEVRAKGFESKEQLRISVLEGILEATEQRLNHYIKRCSELEQEINTIRK